MSMNRQEQKEYTKRALLDSALSLFQDNGYTQTTVQQITDRAGVAKGTFFNYFSSKEEILHTIGEYQMEIIEKHYDNVMSHNESIASAIEQLFNELAAGNEQFGHRLILSTFHITTLQDTAYEKEKSQIQLFHDVMEKLLIEGEKRKEFSLTLSAKEYSIIFINGFFGTLLYWCQNYEKAQLPKLISQFVTSQLAGIRVYS